jgi:periplasmic protein TonB
MSYKALLFCPDEASARLVTQVLSELDFTVELSYEPFATVKKLTEETYDALVVDCANEQNASVLFKGARSSNLNHSCLCVAVAEGQPGLANAFRIGANLVLTKPINIEQSKNTLRVARGLLRKNSPGPVTPNPPSQAKPTSASPPSPPGAPVHAQPTPSAAVAPTVPAMAAPAAAPSMPSSLLEAEQKRPQSTPSFAGPAQTLASTPSFGSTHSTGGFGAAPALAPERTTPTIESKQFREMPAASPLVTQDPIVPQTTFAERHEPAVPTFSSYAQRPAKGGTSKAIWIVPVLLVLGAAGFFGWRKYQPLHYLHLHGTATTEPAAATDQSAASDNNPSSSANISTAEQQSTTVAAPSSASSTAEPTSSTSYAASTAASAPEGFPTKEHIDISAPPLDAPERPVTVTPKPQPLQVSRKAPSAPKTQEQPAPVSAPAPPALVITGNNSADSTIAGLVTTNAPVPKAATTTLRISQGITQGLLIKRVPATYPPSALQLRREGTVELLAAISKSGAISNVKVISGDAMLAKAAVDAVKQWKYRPYLLNGEPVSIETQISMIFKLPH